MKLNWCLILVLLTLFSCKEDIPERPKLPQINSSRWLYVVNEGNFQWGNAGISRFDRISHQLTHDDIFSEINQRPLGDVAQSMTFYAGKAYVVVNNSSRIEVMDSATMFSTGSISGFVSPRYFLPVSASKAYVSDLYANRVAVVNLQTNTIEKYIPLRGWTEEMLLHEGKVLVTNLRTSYLYRINPLTDAVEDSVWLGYPAGSLRADAFGKVWVLCSQVLQANAPSRLVQLNASATQVLRTFNLGTGAGKILCTNGAQTHLFWIRTHVYSMSVLADSLPAVPFISRKSGENFYSLGVDPNNGDVYVGDAVDFVQRGHVTCYTASGTLITSFKSGIIPGNFTFN